MSLYYKIMKNEELAELFKYCSPRSIMVITWYGKLKTLYCPITVKVKNDVGNLSIGNLVKVDAIKLSDTSVTVFIINNKAYYYYHFDILTHLL
ncbi:hypothetical protein [Gelidibacter salicanalis]|uniref:hypothetical protein n=1 Tax=Gelidibacter salicanalis TaxID=291193 RepID=UPI0011BD44DB|nr:hypothetical protein [Gelidibacter salicanalis]